MRIRERFNPRAPCGARRAMTMGAAVYYDISTHAPLAGRDDLFVVQQNSTAKFQPTRPLRGATLRVYGFCRRVANFNPRAPCGARLPTLRVALRLPRFQPTRPLRGATRRRPPGKGETAFHPTRPVRGATPQRGSGPPGLYFNPRAPCGARRYPTFSSFSSSLHFNPRAPCGARLVDL